MPITAIKYAHLNETPIFQSFFFLMQRKIEIKFNYFIFDCFCILINNIIIVYVAIKYIFFFWIFILLMRNTVLKLFSKSKYISIFNTVSESIAYQTENFCSTSNFDFLRTCRIWRNSWKFGRCLLQMGQPLKFKSNSKA